VSDPKDMQEPDELNLEEETVKDLDPGDDAGDVRGGAYEPYPNVPGHKQG